MPVICVSSIDETRLRPYRDLTSTESARSMGLFVAEGKTLVERLLGSEHRVHSVLVERQYLRLIESVVDDETTVYAIDDGLIEDLIGFNFHRGVLACGYRPQNPTFAESLPALHHAATVVVCDAVQDPENLGGILRNCAAFGVGTVVLGPNCTDAFSRRVLRVSMGAALQMSVVHSSDLCRALVSLKDDWQLEVVATVLDDDAEVLDQAVRPRRLALLLGNEAHGVDRQHVRLANRRVTLPMDSRASSLNVAVSSGIFLYHFTRTAHLEPIRKPSAERGTGTFCSEDSTK